MKRYVLLIISILACISHILADDISFTIKVTDTAIKGGQVQLQYILRGGEADDINLNGQVKGFEVLFGPAVAFSQSTSIINGKMLSLIHI